MGVIGILAFQLVESGQVLCSGGGRAGLHLVDGSFSRRNPQAGTRLSRQLCSLAPPRRSPQPEPAAVDPADRRRGGLRGARGALLGAAGRAAREVRGDGGEQPSAPAGAAGAARRAVRSQRQGARREPPLLQHLDRARAHQGPQPHDPAAGGGRPASTKRRCARSSIATAASRRYRPIIDRRRTRRWRRWRPSRRGGSTSSCRTSSSSRCRRGSIPRNDGGASVRVRRRGQRRAGAPTTTALKSGDIVGQAGIEKVYNALLMGEDGAKRVVVNSVGREIRTLRRGRRRPKASGCS